MGTDILRNYMKRLTSYLVLLMSILALTISTTLQAHAVAAVTIGLKTSASSTTVGSDVTITVSVTTAETVSDVRAKVNYDAGKLTFVSADFAGLPLDQDFGSGNFTGYYIVDRGKLSSFPSGTFDVARLTFKAKAAGSAVVSIANGESSVGSGNPADNGAAHAPQTAGSTSITIADAAAPAPAPQQNTAVANPKKTTPNPNATTPTAAEQGLPNDEPVPVAAENEIIDPGYAATIKVVNSEGSPRQGVKVALNGEEKETDENGTAIFEGLALGSYDVTIDGKVQSIMIEGGDKATDQQFVLTSDKKELNKDLIKYAAIAVAILIVLLIIGRMIYKKLQFKKRFGAQAVAPTATQQNISQPIVKVDDDFFKPKTPEAETVIRPTEKQE